MNYASLATYSLLEGEQYILSDHFKKQANNYRRQGLFSANYYPDNQENLLRVLNIWQGQENYEKWQSQQAIGLFGSNHYQAELVCQQIFEMNWEMQHSHLQPAFSSLHTVQIDEPAKQLILLREMGRQKISRVAGMAGIWFGRSPFDPGLCLCQIEWINQAALLDYIKASVDENHEKELENMGITIAHFIGESEEKAISNILNNLKPGPETFLL